MAVPYVLFVATNAAVIGPRNRHTGFFFQIGRAHV